MVFVIFTIPAMSYEACDFGVSCRTTIPDGRPILTGGRILTVPSLQISVAITTFPLASPTWEISPWEREVGHFQYTAWIDNPGNVVIGGHSEYPSGDPGIFYDLGKLRIGDLIYISDADLLRRYVVSEIKIVNYRDLTVLYPTSDSRLTLITCSIPSYVAAQNSYYERVVVIAVEVPG